MKMRNALDRIQLQMARLHRAAEPLDETKIFSLANEMARQGKLAKTINDGDMPAWAESYLEEMKERVFKIAENHPYAAAILPETVAALANIADALGRGFNVTEVDDDEQRPEV